jgi:hypothetical protein
VDRYAKAIVGAIIAALAAAGGATADGSITLAEGTGIAFAFFVALGAIWAVPNAPVAAKKK